MSGFEVEFAFEIGEIVYFQSADHHSAQRPRRFQIVERLAQQCHGGIQRLYRLDFIKDGFVPEICLTREEPEFRPQSMEQLTHDLGVDGAEAARWNRSYDAAKKAARKAAVESDKADDEADG